MTLRRAFYIFENKMRSMKNFIEKIKFCNRYKEWSNRQTSMNNYEMYKMYINMNVKTSEYEYGIHYVIKKNWFD